MARQNQFDKAIKDKVKTLEAEPSARVWAGVREAVPGKSGLGRVFYLRLAALLIVVGLSGGAWWYYSGSSTEKTEGGKQLTQQSQTPDPKEKPSDNAISPATQPTVAPDLEAETDLNANTELALNSDEKNQKSQYDAPLARSSAKTEKKAIENKDNNLPEPIVEPIQELALEGIEETKPIEVAEEAPVEAKNTTLQEVIAREDAQEKEGSVKKAEDVEGESETGRRRRLNLSNLNRDEMRSKTGQVLGNLAQEAGEKIGIQANVKKTETDERQTKKVTVKFGPLKFKRVKNTNR